MAIPFWVVQAGCSGSWSGNTNIASVNGGWTGTHDGMSWRLIFSSLEPLQLGAQNGIQTAYQSLAPAPPSMLPPQCVMIDSFFRWDWGTIFCEDYPINPIRLSVATPFSRFFDLWPPEASPAPRLISAWRTVEFWAKFREQSRHLTSIHLALSDDTEANSDVYPIDYQPLTTYDEWFVAYFKKTFTPEEDTSWSNRNLRANVAFTGQVVPDPPVPIQNQTSVGFEWFAIKLSDPYILIPEGN